MLTQKQGFKILLANRASAKQILLAQQEIHWPWASGLVLISTPGMFISHYLCYIQSGCIHIPEQQVIKFNIKAAS